MQLFKREKRRFSLTAAGEYLYKAGPVLLEKAEQVRKQTIRIGQEEELRLRIGYLSGYKGREFLFKYVSNDEIDLVLSYQRCAYNDKYENFHLRYIPCCVELSVRSRLAQEPAVFTDQLGDISCIFVTRKDQQELEKGLYQNVLGIGNQFYFVESIDDARFAVFGNRGFLPIVDSGNLPETGDSIRRIPLLRKDHEPIQLNFCAFWKKGTKQLLYRRICIHV